MGEVIAAIFLISGAIFMLIASIGIIRLPDLYMRMHATLKASTLGMLLLLLALCGYMPDVFNAIKAILIMLFIFLTAPVASQMIGRVAHLMNIKKWEKTRQDDLGNAQQESSTRPAAGNEM